MKFSMIAIFVICCGLVSAFVPTRQSARARVAPLNENFFLDIGEDPAVNTPREIFGEVALKGYVGTYKPDALILGGPKYNIVERIRELKLLKLTAESGLLEALEARGITLSKLESLLPVVDNLGVLPLVSKNKDTLISFAPLLIEPAPLLIPVLASVLTTPASNFIGPGAILLATGAYETYEGAGLLGIPLLLLGAPLTLLGTVLSGSISLPSASSDSSSSFSSAPADATPSFGPKISFSSAPKAAAQSESSNRMNGKRKVIRIK